MANLKFCFLLVTIGIALGVLAKFAFEIYERKKCSGKTTGKISYMNDRMVISGRYGNTVQKVPVYEFKVDGKAYLAEIELVNPGSFPGEVEVKYDPADPNVCYIMGMRGTMQWKNEEK